MSEQLPRDILQGWDIVLIDDDAPSLEISQILLEHYGASVHTATNGEAGLMLINQIKPKVVITDLSMPVMDGWVLHNRIRSNPDLARIPVIALTAHAMVGDKEKVMEAGFTSYISKPIMPATFVKEFVTILKGIPEFDIKLSS
jgi:two-component system cell cycle response regulator